MDITLNHEEYKYLKILSDNTIEESVEAELSLPEYMPEILRIIKPTAEIKVNSCSVVGDRVTVDGVCELRMIYTAEDGGLYTYSQTRPFVRHCEKSDFENAADVDAKVSVSYVNCRATSTKRADIKAGLTIKFNVYLAQCEDIISLNNSLVEQKTKSVRVKSLGCKKTRSFSMSDTVTLNNPAAFIVSVKTAAVCTETRKINNKIMVKGEALTDICYVNSNDKTMSEHVKHTMPINQILEFDGMDERFNGDVFLRVSSADVLMKGETSGVATAFDISLVIDSGITMWDEKELVIIEDAYAVNKALNIQKSPCTFFCELDEINDNHNFTGELSVSGEGVYSITDAFGELINLQVKSENDEVVITGEINTSVIIRDSSGNLSCINKIFDYSYKKKGEFAGKKIFCKPDVIIKSLECKVKTQSNVEVIAEIHVNGRVFEVMLSDVVTNLTEGDAPVARNYNAITVYFPENNEESLWTIARRYNTTVKAIAEENELTGDTTENLKMLFIPVV